MSESIDLIPTAYHEAGHAVVAALQYKRNKNGFSYKQAAPFGSVTIRPKGNAEFDGKCYKVFGRLNLRLKSTACQAHMITLVAGTLSEAQVQPHNWRDQMPETSKSDFRMFDELIECFQMNDDDVKEIIDLGSGEVLRAWPAIKAVAQDLLEKGTVKRKEVVARCEEHGVKPTYWVFEPE